MTSVPGAAVDGTLAGSIWLSACRLAVNVSVGGDVDCPELPVRSDAIKPDMVETKSCFDTLPLPLGSSAAKIAAALTGASRNALYARALELKDRTDEAGD